MAITIPIISEFDGKGISRAVEEFKQLEGAGAKAKFAIQKAAIPAAAAIGGLAAGLTVATKAAIEDAAAQDKLAGVLRRSGMATDEQIAATERFITAQSKLTAVSDDELRPALQPLAFSLEPASADAPATGSGAVPGATGGQPAPGGFVLESRSVPVESIGD